jgi:hypothetical protein
LSAGATRVFWGNALLIPSGERSKMAADIDWTQVVSFISFSDDINLKRRGVGPGKQDCAAAQVGFCGPRAESFGYLANDASANLLTFSNTLNQFTRLPGLALALSLQVAVL